MLQTIRALSDEALARLLRERLDLAVPKPASLVALAARAQSAMSVSRAMDLLDEPTLRVLDGLRLAGVGQPVALDAVAALTTSPTVLSGALRRLRELALVWGPDEELRFPESVAEVAGPYPAGLGRPAEELSEAAGELAGDAAALRRAIMAASPQARAVLERLAAGPPIGTVSDAYSQAESDTPVRWLISRDLLVPVADDTVELPREVAVLLRRDTGPLGQLRDRPEPTGSGPGLKIVDTSCAATVLDVVGHTESILSTLGKDPAAEVRSGGIGMQRLHRIARDSGLTDSQVGLILELSYATGLLGRGTAASATGWMPSGGFDGWLAGDSAGRWARLAKAWLATPRDVRLLGTRPGQSKPNTVLSDQLTSRLAPAWRREVLQVLAEPTPGTAIDADTLVEILRWRHPRRRNDELVRAVLEQAAFLGITVADTLTAPGRALLSEPDPDDPLGIHAPETDPVVTALRDILPSPVDHLIVQSDLTVIVPGPASVLLASELALVTEPESQSVHRVTETSLRRAMDAGYAVEDIHSLFARRAHGELPQTLTYLIDDVARRYGGMRTGSAGCYVRSDDPTLIAQLLADRRLRSLRLRRLAPTVLVSGYLLTDLLSALRGAGYAPVTEDHTGDLVIDRNPAPRSIRTERPESDTEAEPHVDEAPLLALVEQLRLADAQSSGDEGEFAEEVHRVLDAAIPQRQPVWVEYSDARGDVVRRLLRPMSLRAGYLRAEDRRTDMLHTIALHAIRSVTPATV
ncbi:helicase-associated domain-containing protein [Stackebrandtia endophytica]|uniref:helicase-associated domain-containing protein n=1 Tax=Stackebrandtia endophytica TaxID=1496996 RepID=UPI001B870867|nr:helicase-associated domain-containing protein [Stackebrandtia endophytica]